MWHICLSYFCYWCGLVCRYFALHWGDRRVFEQAAHFFRRAHQIDPSFHRAQLDYALMLWRELGRAQPALETLDDLLDKAPTYAPALLNRAQIHQTRWHLPQALADWEAYLALTDPSDAYWSQAVRTLEQLRQTLEEQPPA